MNQATFLVLKNVKYAANVHIDIWLLIGDIQSQEHMALF